MLNIVSKERIYNMSHRNSNYDPNQMTPIPIGQTFSAIMFTMCEGIESKLHIYNLSNHLTM